MTRIAVAVSALLVILGGPSRADDTLKLGDVISGPLRFFRSQHPNGTWINVYQIASDHPRMFAEKDEFCPDYPPKTFHLVVMNDKAKETRLKRMLGKKVAVIGEAFSCSETAWHIGDAVVFEWRFAEPDKR